MSKTNTTPDQIEKFKECARYIVEFEQDDWKDSVFNGDTVESHIFAVAYRALFGESAFDEICADLEQEMKAKT